MLALALLIGLVPPVAGQESVAPQPEQIFKATLHLTRSDQGFRAAWAQGPGALLPTTGTIGLAAPVFGLLSVAGCTVRPDGKCDLEISWRTAGPDGVFDAPRPIANWRPQPGADGRAMLAPGGLRLALDRSDPPGRYTIEASVTDKRIGRTLVLEASAMKAESEAPGR